MRYITVIILLLCVVGCGSAHYDYVQSSNQAFEAIVPNYCAYIAKDESLSKLDKEIRLKTAKEALKMSQEELARVEK